MIALGRKNGQRGNDASEDENENSDDENDEDRSQEDEEESESGESDDEKEHTVEDDKFSDLVYDSASEDDTEPNEVIVEKSAKKAKNDVPPKVAPTPEERAAMMAKAAKELPYTFELPLKYDDLEKLLAGQSAPHQAVILERMIKCNHPKVEPANKDRMVPLFAFLLQHLDDVASSASEENASHCFSVLEVLAPHLYDLSHLNPNDTSKCFLEVIKEKQSDFKSNDRHYPALDTLVFLKLASHLYSTSDFRHPIISPCVILISQILTKCRVHTRRDISVGLFLVTIVLDYAQQSSRFLPAAVNFLSGIFYLCAPKRPIQQLKTIPPFKSSAELASLLVLSEKVKKPTSNCCYLTASDLVAHKIDDSFKVRALNTTLLLANDLLQMLQENAAAKLLVEPLMKNLKLIDIDRYPALISENRNKCKQSASLITQKRLTYLVPAQRKPKQLRQFEPLIEKIYDDRRNRKPGQEQKGIRDGLKQKIKRVTKGAVREIRRDNAFLAKIRLKKQIQG